jgi:hypothetical protein
MESCFPSQLAAVGSARVRPRAGVRARYRRLEIDTSRHVSSILTACRLLCAKNHSPATPHQRATPAKTCARTSAIVGFANVECRYVPSGCL